MATKGYWEREWEKVMATEDYWKKFFNSLEEIDKYTVVLAGSFST